RPTGVRERPRPRRVSPAGPAPLSSTFEAWTYASADRLGWLSPLVLLSCSHVLIAGRSAGVSGSNINALYPRSRTACAPPLPSTPHLSTYSRWSRRHTFIASSIRQRDRRRIVSSYEHCPQRPIIRRHPWSPRSCDFSHSAPIGLKGRLA